MNTIIIMSLMVATLPSLVLLYECQRYQCLTVKALLQKAEEQYLYDGLVRYAQFYSRTYRDGLPRTVTVSPNTVSTATISFTPFHEGVQISIHVTRRGKKSMTIKHLVRDA